MYVCGVTVYDLSHIGHARVYVAFDILYRLLTAGLGYRVQYVRNFTDIDDKIIARANEKGEDPLELANRFIVEFHKDMQALGCLPPSQEPKATDFIPDMVEMIQAGPGRVKDRGWWWVAAQQAAAPHGRAGERVALDQRKRGPADFALWKAAKPGEPSWPSPWGPGRPGWHIECSAMIAKVMGPGPPHFPATCVPPPLPKVLRSYHPLALRWFLSSTHYRAPVNFSSRALDEASARLYYVLQALLDASQALAAAGAAGQAAQASATASGPGWGALLPALLDDLNTPAALAALSAPLKAINDLLSTKAGRKAADRLQQLARHQAAIASGLQLLGLVPTRLSSASETALAPPPGTPAEVAGTVADASGSEAETPGTTADAPRDALTPRPQTLTMVESALPDDTVLLRVLAELRGLALIRVGLDEAHVAGRMQARAAARAAKDFAAADAIRIELAQQGVAIMDLPDGSTTWRPVQVGPWAALSGWKAAGKIAPHAPAPVAVCAYLASLHAGYMVLSTLSLALNTVSFYQVCKIASTPVVILLELVLFKKVPRMVVCVSVLCVCAGIAIATINDPISIKNVSGMVVGLLSTVVTALFNIQAGALQRQTGLNSQQLLVSYTPYATGLLATMVLVMEPCGLWPGQGALINKNLAANLFRFNMTSHAAFVIISSAVIGVAVSLTTFLAIAGTSTLTYSVVGHMKTLLVLLGALLGLGEEMPWKRGLGICAAFGGIVWYTLLVTLWREDVGPAERKTSKDDAEGDEKALLIKSDVEGSRLRR
ncbi:tRNA synthetases class I (C) catalytic domain-containing protein [Haematococcus lacustris]